MISVKEIITEEPILLKEIKTEKTVNVENVSNAIIKKGFSPYIGTNGNWYEYDNETEQFKDTGIKAEGKTPTKGTDYFTTQDKNEIKNMVKNEITIPTKTSQLTNDSGYIDNTYHDTTKQDVINDLEAIRSKSNSALQSIPSNYKTKDENDNLYQPKGNYLTEHQPIKTINNQPIVGTGNITIEGGSGVSDYADLSNKPKINNVELNGNKTLADFGINNFSGNYEDLSNKPTIPTVPTDEISANTNARHTHTNKTVLDGITSTKVQEWDNKSTFDGNYNNLTNKPTIPTVTNDFTNDYKNKVDTLYSDYLSASEVVG